jgi:hypothetical protein
MIVNNRKNCVKTVSIRLYLDSDYEFRFQGVDALVLNCGEMLQQAVNACKNRPDSSPSSKDDMV